MTQESGSLFLFAVSAGLLAGTTTLLARRLARAPTELLWVVPALVSLQVGTFACLLSVVRWMTPPRWLALQTLVLLLVLVRTRQTSPPRRLGVREAFRGWWGGAPALARAALVLAILFVAASGVRQAASPISGFDDRMYHASRVAYWMQNASLLPYPTHNERQVAFPFGSELYFLWPVLLTKAEVAGRVVFWLALPLTAVGIHVTAGKAGVPEPFRSLAVLLFTSTPIVGWLSLGLAPEFWLAFFEVGTAYWILDAARAGEGPEAIRSTGWAGLFFLLAMNVKTTALGLAVPVALLPLVFVRRTARGPAFRSLVIGALAGWTLSGLLLNNLGNLARCGNLTASPGLRAVVRSDLNARQLYIHAARLPFLLFELPWVPSSRRQGLEARGDALATAVGATQLISSEDSPWSWPGRFHFTVAPKARLYSLGGILWLPGLALAAFVVLRGVRGDRDEARRDPLLLGTLVALSSLVPVVFGVRWMVGSGVPARFLIASWGVGLISLAALVSRAAASRGGVALAAAALAGAQVLAAVPGEWAATSALLTARTPEASLDEPFAAVVPLLPAGSRILLFADQETRDYPLFQPRKGFSSVVIPWGDGAPDRSSILNRVVSGSLTHVLFTQDEWLNRHWAPAVPVAAALRQLAADPRFLEIGTGTPGMHLFRFEPADGAPETPGNH